MYMKHLSTKTKKEKKVGTPSRGTNGRFNETVKYLRTHIKGKLILPEDPEYDQARTIFYGGFERRPAVIVRPVNTADIARVVLLARETEMELAIRSGGHSSAGHSVAEGGIVLDLRDMRKLQIDAKSQTAWAESGLTAGEFTNIADKHNLAVGFGDTSSVGIGGLTLGGGIGYLVRKHGLTIDNLLAAEMVTADGKSLLVDADNHSDLFWAIRGGGGNFGVATRFQYQLHSISDVIGGVLTLPATPDVIAGFIAAAEAAPDELSAIVNIMPAPPLPFIPEEHHGKLIMMVMIVYSGDISTGGSVLAPFRSLANPIADMVGPMRYPAIYGPEENSEFHPKAVGHTMFLDRIDLDVAETIYEYLQSSNAGMRVVQLRVLGGAMARVPVVATAFAHRMSRIMVNLVSSYDSPEDQLVRQKWIDEFAHTLQQDDRGAYVNFLGEEGESRVRDAYPNPTWDRLVDIKARYDPTNLFRLNQNIPPSASKSTEGF